jgi:hypothetical protein
MLLINLLHLFCVACFFHCCLLGSTLAFFKYPFSAVSNFEYSQVLQSVMIRSFFKYSKIPSYCSVGGSAGLASNSNKNSPSSSTKRSSFPESNNLTSELSPKRRLSLPMFNGNHFSPESGRSMGFRFPYGDFRDSRFAANPGCDMELIFLGTASCMPSPTRGTIA